ncbi:MAG TPA: protein translocase subunit SecD [Myxococcota bacterium]|nr:protein translocase subunit SecD [Myxococcota bacterium]
MSSGLRWRLGLTGGLVALMTYLTIANFVPAETRHKHWWLPDQGIRLGLDLQGGIHWVLGAKLDVAIEHELDHLRGRLADQLTEQKITPTHLAVEGQRIVVELATNEEVDKARTLAEDSRVLRVSQAQGTKLELELTSQWMKDVREKGMAQVLEVLRRRIEDPIQGIQDSVVTRQGEDRILVQIPGGQMDRARAREMLRVTGFLEFKIVQDQAPTEELLRAKHKDGLPEGTEIVFEREKQSNRIVTAYLVKKTPDLTGDYLSDARVQTDPIRGWIVSFTFNSEGAKIFSELTEKNVNRPLAIVLDKQVYSAPNIKQRIGAQGQIEGRFTSQTAADLAVVLRSGSLAIPVAIEEERTVGPELGADSIRSGLRASVVAVLAVVVFATVYYRLSGVYASIALGANLFLLLGIMSMAGATLTLPGIAGLVLTVGMAIDANVIIFERIREELRNGRTPRAAVATGFNKALWTILDANITTLISAVVLFQYGTGPIKGFAVTLCIGIVTSVFAAIVITRLLYALWPGDRRVAELSI